MPRTLHPDIDWTILGQCDGQIVRQTIEYGCRPAQVANRLQRERVFQKIMAEEKLFEECYKFMRNLYGSIESEFSIKHDNFAGYKLLYCGKNPIPSRTVILNGPKGVLRPIPHHATDLSVIYKFSDKKKKSFIMLGPIRFINSDCNPNCEYDFSSLDKTLVRVRTLRKIKPTEEILVKHGDDFFENMECECQTCSSNRKLAEEYQMTEQAEAKELSEYTEHVEIDNLLTQDQMSNYVQTHTPGQPMDNDRVLLADLVTENNVTSSYIERFTNTERSPEVVKKKMRMRRPYKCRLYENIIKDIAERQAEQMLDLNNLSAEELNLHQVDSKDQTSRSKNFLDDNTSPFENNHMKGDSSYQEQLQPVVDPPRTSSPLPSAFQPFPPENCQILQHSIDNINLVGESVSQMSWRHFDSNQFLSFRSKENEENSVCESYEPLYPNCRVGYHNTQLLIRAFTNFYKISDACQTDLLKLIEAITPGPNLLPSAYTCIQKVKARFESLTAKVLRSPHSETCVLKVSELLKDIVQGNIISLLEYNIKRCRGEAPDMPLDLISISEQPNEFCIDLILSTDGVSFVSSSGNHQMYPVWLAVAQLPPILRMSKKNIALAALFVGRGKPIWSELLPQLKTEIQRSVVVQMPNGSLYFLKFNVVLIVADLIAKPSLLNMYQHNGYYGCQYCDHPGVSYGSTHCYYPLNLVVNNEVYRVKRKIREPSDHLHLVEKADNFLREGNKAVNMAGVKGKSPFSSLVKGLPLSAPVDYMHCVLLGVFSSLLSRQLKLLKQRERDEFDDLFRNLSLPVELCQHGRKPRPSSEITQFKANEFFNYLFFLAPVIFRSFLKPGCLQYESLLRLSFGIRILLQTQQEANITRAEKLLMRFSEDAVEIFGDKKCETINVHCLQHLPDQVRRFGPLFVMSAMAFESAHSFLAHFATGSHGFCQIISRRYLEYHELLKASVERDDLTLLARAWTNQEEVSQREKILQKELHETIQVSTARRLHPNAQIVSRCRLGRYFFDSLCYKRNLKGPNSHVYCQLKESLIFGQIEYFITFEDSVDQYAYVTLYETIRTSLSDDIDLKFRNFVQVVRSNQTMWLQVNQLKKLALLENKTEKWLAFVPKFIDHK